MRSEFAPPILFSLALLLLPPMGQATNPATSIGGTDSWTLAKPPVYCTVGSERCYEVTYKNNLNMTSMGFVYLVINNAIGQTVSYSTVILNLTAGANGTGYPVVAGLGPGEYNATFFVTAPSGIAISSTTTATFIIYSLDFFTTPTICHIEATCLNATMSNYEEHDITAIVFALFQNATTGGGISDAVAICNFSAAGPSKCYLTVYGLPSGKYDVTVFATAIDGKTRLSPTATITIAIGQ